MIVRADSATVHELYPAANFEPRRDGMRPSILILHYTGVASAAKAIDWLSRPDSGVSCHYVIDETGCITQMVAEAARAWHAGEASWAGATDINSASIGIEIQNPGHDLGYPDFPEPQLAAVEALARDILRRHAIRPERVLAHSDVAPRRKIDPGEKFPWGRLAAAGVGHWVEPAPLVDAEPGIGVGAAGPQFAELQGQLRDYGYAIEPTGLVDGATEFVIKAFQRHFRPARVDGRIDGSTIATLARLTAALPAAA
ncbi:MAG TPA: N-acetylmuramoyl-L-alanine amidase [Hyphomicrobiaceae bacterium]|nr:N-acetylmuramoyl-L-alanine amidase [Hyphomicrobiaceae bacterium]